MNKLLLDESIPVKKAVQVHKDKYPVKNYHQGYKIVNILMTTGSYTQTIEG